MNSKSTSSDPKDAMPNRPKIGKHWRTWKTMPGMLLGTANTRSRWKKRQEKLKSN
jgi:hypothetical protein